MFKDIKKRCYPQFLEAKKRGRKINFTSDKLGHYKKGFNKYFYNVATLAHGVPIACKKYKLKHNNNCIERDHQYSRKLECNSRGHKSFKGATALFNLGDIYYNFIDKQRLEHEETWRTPAQRAGIHINFGEKHQLLNLIKIAYPKD
jgi:transposase-like protein